MRKTTALIAAIMLLVFSAAAFAADGQMSYADAKAEAAKLGKPLLVDFYTTW